MRLMRTAGVVAILALVAAASMASTASALEFRSTISPETMFGAQDVAGIHKFEIEKQVTECKQANMEAVGVAFPTKMLKLTPTWQLKANECTIAFGYTSTREVDPEGCTFELLEPVGATPVGNLAIRCPATKSIKLRGGSAFGTCEARIGEANNTNLPSITYQNLGGTPSKFSAKFAITGITVNKTVDTGNCGLAGTGVINTATYSGTSVFQGKGGAGVEIK